MFEKIINMIIETPEWSALIGLIISGVIDFKLPEGHKFKIWTHIIELIGSILMSPVMKSIDKRFNTITTNYAELHNSLAELKDKLEQLTNDSRESTRVMLKQDIRKLYETCKKRGYILDKEKKCFLDMCAIYKACGGNSFVSEQVEPFMDRLHCFETEEEAEEHKKIYGKY